MISLLEAFNGSIDTNRLGPSQRPKTPPRSSSSGFSDMKFTHALIKHLDKLYGRILGDELSEVVNQADIVGDINGIPLVRKNSYYNPGHSSVTESA